MPSHLTAEEKAAFFKLTPTQLIMAMNSAVRVAFSTIAYTVRHTKRGVCAPRLHSMRGN